MKRSSYNNFFMNFATESKFGIIMALKDGPLSVNEIVNRVGDEQSAVSHSLRKMSGCHILNVRKDGKQRIYSLNEDTVLPMLKIVEKHVKKCCLGRDYDG
ncbi:MAG: winged helix-turn-helix transcriptional regulator [Candidatus Aenigmatarchaeota archaeon]|nr:MAG: winged helix-turn-helix transcriptional regulator [Candidatus Aenigmarchaeota archaeon]